MNNKQKEYFYIFLAIVIFLAVIFGCVLIYVQSEKNSDAYLQDKIDNPICIISMKHVGTKMLRDIYGFKLDCEDEIIEVPYDIWKDSMVGEEYDRINFMVLKEE